MGLKTCGKMQRLFWDPYIEQCRDCARRQGKIRREGKGRRWGRKKRGRGMPRKEKTRAESKAEMGRVEWKESSD